MFKASERERIIVAFYKNLASAFAMIEKAGPDNQPSELIKALNANTEILRQEFRDVCDAAGKADTRVEYT